MTSAFDRAVAPYVADLPDRLREVATRMAQEITEDMTEGAVGEVNSFSDLYDYVDVDGYAGLCDINDNGDITTEQLMTIHNALNNWLAGR